VLAAQREALLQMRRDGRLSNQIRRILHDLELDESSLDRPPAA
jgi:hypothetical protein